jgi:N-acetylglucosamine kinase-like BadF-type ATPase
MSPRKQLHLCIDCGGSKTSAVLAAAVTGRILTRTTGGPSNFKYLGPKDFSAVVQETLNRALGEESVLRYLAGVDESDTSSVEQGDVGTKITLPVKESRSPFLSAWIAASGVDTSSDVHNASSALSPILGIPLGPRLIVTNDTHLLAAPLATQSIHPSCITIVAGTGSCIVSFRRTETGIKVAELVRTGGYGWILGDEGGGFHVGRETVRELCYQEDMEVLHGGPLVEFTEDTRPTHDLRTLVFSYFGLKPEAKTSDIFAELYAPDPNASLAKEQVLDSATTANGHLLLERQQRLSRLTPLVFKAAFPPSDPEERKSFRPNPIAAKILTMCASAMADMIILLCAPRPTPPPLDSANPLLVPPNVPPAKPKHVHSEETLLCLGGSLVKQKPYRDLLVAVLEKKGYKFAGAIFVEDCEKGGIDALVAQTK